MAIRSLVGRLTIDECFVKESDFGGIDKPQVGYDRAVIRVKSGKG